MTLSEWADRYRIMSREASASPGRWRTDTAPYQREIMDAVTDMSVKKVVVMSAAQIGKTDMAILNPIGYFVHYDPSPIMVVLPTIAMGETFSKDRLSPMIRDTRVLAERITDKSRQSGNTILQKNFAGGQVTIVGANSSSSLSSRPIRILLADEIDRYPPTAGNEGDPLMLAEKRTTTFWNRKEVNVSTPTLASTSRIAAEFKHSTKEEWTVPCPECGEFNPLTWSRIVFKKDDPKSVTMVCSFCGAESSEQRWKEAGQRGKWKAENPDAEVRGFHLNSLASPFTDWADIVQKFLEAKEEAKRGNTERLKVWTNTEMGECWEDDGVGAPDDVDERREEYGAEVPENVLCLTAGVDTQDDRFEVEVVGWGEGKESWGIRYQVIRGDMKTQAPWKELDEFLETEFEREDGQKLKIACTCIDSGGHFTTEVYRFCKERYWRKIYAIKGKGGADRAFINKPTKNNRVQAPLFTIGTDTGKSLLYQRLNVKEEGANYCHFPINPEAGYDDVYFKGLTSEIMVLTYKKGVACYEWRLKGSEKRNEALDCRNYAQAALEILNPRLKKDEGEKRRARARRKRN